VDAEYRKNHEGAALSTLTLGHLINPSAKGVNISSAFPLAAEIVTTFHVLSNSAAFQAFFEYDLPENECVVNATAFRTLMRLLDNYVRSSVVFSQNNGDLAPLLTTPRVPVDQRNAAVRDFINDNWKTMYAKLLQSPAVVLESMHTMNFVTQAVRELESTAEPKAVLMCLQKFFKERNAAAVKVAEIVAAVVLSPQSLTFSAAKLDFTSMQGVKINTVGETGKGAPKRTVLIIPPLLQSDGAPIGKAYVYKINQ
jgi:hypothetical protein